MRRDGGTGGGMLVAVVGPSGSGKDTLINAARGPLGAQERFYFVRRVVTRAPLEGEDHEAIDDKTFATRQSAGAFALAWRAHGLQYGIPAEIGLPVAEGKIVVACVSRTVLTDAAARYPLHVVEIVASPDVLARRLAARGRDDAVGVAARLARTIKLPEGLSCDTIVNDGTIEQGGR
ncbi:MAG: phosphonate metabolism protein/1,5-bisphosphokinase (PRPP-forming) PhnN, partial [Acetobacteraceae bacterium]